MELIGRSHLFICPGDEPANATSQPFRQMQPQGLSQHHVGEVLCHQKAARLPLAQPLHHPLQKPAQRSAALSDSFRMCTMGGSAPNRMPA
jgi:hypothetical protein